VPLDLALADLRVVVTAGASGIGHSIAETLLAEGASVALCDVDADAVAAVDLGDRCRAWVADVSSTGSVDRFMAEALEWLGGIDVLVNNAGIAGPGGRIEDLDPDEATRVMDIDVSSMFRTSRHAIPPMVDQASGVIVNLSSTAGLDGFPYRSPYAAAKWAVIGLTKTMAMELGEFGIRVNAICPGSINGPRMDHVIDLEAQASGRTADDIRRGFERQVSLQTFIDPEDIANTVAFLASPLGAKITGQALPVDGHTESMRT
jgi:NAD(P)-dependent dehydrogenase (short-subunit alcohol dehydrogenase family)